MFIVPSDLNLIIQTTIHQTLGLELGYLQGFSNYASKIHDTFDTMSLKKDLDISWQQ